MRASASFTRNGSPKRVPKRANSADIHPKEIHPACVTKKGGRFSLNNFAVMLQLLKHFFHERLVIRKSRGADHQIYLHVGSRKGLFDFRREFIGSFPGA